MSLPRSIASAQSLNVAFKVLPKNSATVQSKDLRKNAIDREEHAEDYGYLSDSDLEDDEDEKVPSVKQKSKSKVHQFESCGVPGGDRRIPCEEHEEYTAQGKVVKIPDVAFVT